GELQRQNLSISRLPQRRRRVELQINQDTAAQKQQQQDSRNQRRKSLEQLRIHRVPQRIRQRQERPDPQGDSDGMQPDRGSGQPDGRRAARMAAGSQGSTQHKKRRSSQQP